MAEICKKCPNYRFKDSEQDDRDGCRLKRPLANCPHLLIVYALPDKWYSNYRPNSQSRLTSQLCADDLKEAFVK